VNKQSLSGPQPTDISHTRRPPAWWSGPPQKITVPSLEVLEVAGLGSEDFRFFSKEGRAADRRAHGGHNAVACSREEALAAQVDGRR